MRDIKRKYNTKSNTTSFKKGHKGLVGANNPMWKGDEAGYGSKHDWIKKWHGEPEFCEGCGKEEAKKFDWANLSGKYLRDRSDWVRLCRSCHQIHDEARKKMWITRRAYA